MRRRPGAASPPHRPRPPTAVLLLVAALAVSGALTGLLAGRLPGSPAPPSPLAVVVLGGFLAAAAALSMPVRYRGQANHVDLFEVALAPALLVLPGPVLVLLVATAKAAAETAHRRSPVKACFNVAQWAAAAGAAGTVLAAVRPPGASLPGDLLALLVAMAVAVGVNAAAVRGVLRLVAAGPRRRWPQSSLGLRAWAVHRGVTVAVGVLFALAWQVVPQSAPAFAVALVALHLATRAASARRVELARVLGLQRAHRALLRHPDPLDAVPTFLTELRAAFDCEAAELHLSRGSDVAAYRADRDAGPAPGTGRAAGADPERHPGGGWREVLQGGLAPARLVPLRPDTPLSRLLLAGGAHDALVAPVPGPDGAPAGVLCTLDRAGAQVFESGELTVLESAAGVLGEALERGRLLQALVAQQRAVTASEARWRALVQDVSDLVVVTDADLVVRFASPASRSMLGVPEHELLGRPFCDLVHGADAGRVRSQLQRLLRQPGGSDRTEFRLPTSTAHAWVEAAAHDLRADPAVAGVVLSLRDIGERHRADAFNAGAARVLELTARGEPLEVLIAELADVLAGQVEASWCALLPAGSDADTLVAPGVPGWLLAAVQPLLAELGAAGAHGPLAPLVVADTGDDPRCPVWGPSARRAGVAALWLEPVGVGAPATRPAVLVVARADPGVPTRQEAGRLRAAAGLAHTAVQHVRTRARLAHQAAHDPLTDLPNRALFADRLQHALDRSRRAPTSTLVLFLDLDDFKDVNDSLGHRTGDELLHAVGLRLQAAVRPGDTVARFGGDEFTILCEAVRDEGHAVEIADRIRAALARPFAVAGRDLFVTASIGLALADDPATDPEALIENADAAMYRAKARGDQSYEVFDEGMRSRAARRLRTQSALHRAVDRGEFHLVYQPTVALSTGRVVGVEALVRWQHPEAGLLLPEHFIPLAEETGLILPIGAQVLAQACAQASAWSAAAATGPAAGRSTVPTVSVNLSARQLTDPHLVGSVARALDASGADPRSIYLEITESAVMHDVETSGATLRRLKDLGVRLLVDDFGTGYSSLGYLRRLPVDGLKVDRSFVAGLGVDGEDDVIVRAVVNLAHSLGLLAVAEGVETEAQAEALRRLDCEIGQGWHFGYPVDAGLLDVGAVDAASRLAR